MNQSENFFIVRLRGGLGNQLFQYAFARIYSLVHNRPCKADTSGYANPELQRVPRGYKLEKFNLTLPLATDEEIQNFKYPFGIVSKIWRGIKIKIFKLDYLDYHPQLLKKNINYIDGYFQSPLYYIGYEEIIKKECSVRAEYISKEAQKVAEHMKECISVAVHIRRGDLVSEIDAAKAQGLCSLQYYDQAQGRMNAEVTMISKENPEEKEPTYFVFSDDIYWVQDNMEFPEGTVFVSALHLQDFEELYLMTMAKHNIIGNSTFSWWGAWLNQNEKKVVIAPRQWTTKNTEHPTIIPKNWIRI